MCIRNNIGTPPQPRIDNSVSFPRSYEADLAARRLFRSSVMVSLTPLSRGSEM